MNKEEFITALLEAMDSIGIVPDDEQREKFYCFYEELVAVNQVMNLTAITDPRDVIDKHFLDSACLHRLNEVRFTADTVVLDVGTGAGFPGIPLAILHRDTRFVLNDTLQKRIGFIRNTCEKLGMENITAIHARAEDMAGDSLHRGRYDYVLSRAVANLATLSEYCLPFVKMGGMFIAYKSAESDEEILQAKKAIGILGGELVEVKKFMLGLENAGRALVCVRKVRETPKGYPRRAGIPAKQPIV